MKPVANNIFILKHVTNKEKRSHVVIWEFTFHLSQPKLSDLFENTGISRTQK